MFWVFAVKGNETCILLGHWAGGNETHKFWESKLRETKPIQCLGIEGEGKHIFWVFAVEGKETRMGLRETKPINFGSHKAEGNETNTVLGY